MAEVLSEIILIAITMMSAIGVSGYFYSTIGAYQNSAVVSATVSNCNPDTGVCSLSLTNVGTLDTNVFAGAGCATLSYSGTKVMADGCSAAGGSVKSAKTTIATAMFTSPMSPMPRSGQRLTGTISLTNGATIYFAGTFA